MQSPGPSSREKGKSGPTSVGSGTSWPRCSSVRAWSNRCGSCSSVSRTLRSQRRSRRFGVTPHDRTSKPRERNMTRSSPSFRYLASRSGIRTNPKGLLQLRELLVGSGVQVEPVPLPHCKGPEACLHLMSLISLVDEDLAVIYPRLLPAGFHVTLEKLGFDFIKVPDVEFDRM